MGAGRAADRRLAPFVALVIAAGVACVGWAALHLSVPSSWLYVGFVAALVAVAMVCAPRLRIAGEPHQVTCASATILIALAALPTPWALIAVAIGVIAAQFFRASHRAHQIAFNAAAHVIGAATAAVAVTACGLAVGLSVRPHGHWVAQIAALLIAAVAYAVVDETLTPTVIAIASHRSWRAVVSPDADIRSTVRLANLLVAVGGGHAARLSPGPGSGHAVRHRAGLSDGHAAAEASR